MSRRRADDVATDEPRPVDHGGGWAIDQRIPSLAPWRAPTGRRHASFARMPRLRRATALVALAAAPAVVAAQQGAAPLDTGVRVAAGDRARLRVGLPVRTVTGLVVAVGDSGVVLVSDGAGGARTTWRPTQLYGFEVARGRRSRLAYAVPAAIGGALAMLVVRSAVGDAAFSGAPERTLPTFALTGALAGGIGSLFVRPPVRWVDAMATIPGGPLTRSIVP